MTIGDHHFNITDPATDHKFSIKYFTKTGMLGENASAIYIGLNRGCTFL
jgi:hypothetical protein